MRKIVVKKRMEGRLYETGNKQRVMESAPTGGVSRVFLFSCQLNGTLITRVPTILLFYSISTINLAALRALEWTHVRTYIPIYLSIFIHIDRLT